MALEDVDTPALLVDLDALDRNIARMAELGAAAGVRLRPHAKTHKSPAIALKQIAPARSASAARRSARPRRWCAAA